MQKQIYAKKEEYEEVSVSGRFQNSPEAWNARTPARVQE
jgi:hypothetical protein